MTFQEDVGSFMKRIVQAEAEREGWRLAGHEEKYLEAYFRVEALERQLDELCRKNASTPS
jgi:hypothetical protein